MRRLQQGKNVRFSQGVISQNGHASINSCSKDRYQDYKMTPIELFPTLSSTGFFWLLSVPESNAQKNA